MCGITGAVLKDGTGSAAQFLLPALKRLEYRGYDSAGQATILRGQICISKDAGRIDDVSQRLHLASMEGCVGIAHTRWATHGVPCMDNAHPLMDCSGRIAIVHNGIIENFMELKTWLKAEGHRFTSRTDSEVIVHLIEKTMKTGNVDPINATAEALRQVLGSYAIAAVFADYPDRIIAASHESPLIIGLGTDGVYCASDIPAILPVTRKIVVLEEGDIAELKADNVTIKSIQTGQKVERKIEQLAFGPDAAEKGGYPHFMLKEIFEQPQVLRDALKIPQRYIADVVSILNEADSLVLSGCGTSYHAAIAGEYSLAKIARTEAKTVVASEFESLLEPTVRQNDVVLFLSQSGETIDTMAAAKCARAKGAKLVAVTNTLGSSLTRMVDAYVIQNSGPEIAVAATKTFAAQVLVLNRIAVELARTRGELTEAEYRIYNRELNELPGIVSTVLSQQHNNVKAIARKYSKRAGICFLGRGASVSTALEGRLKILELAYVPAIAYPAGESKHGFISIVEKGYPVVFIAPRDETQTRLVGNIMEMKARGADIISVCRQGDSRVVDLSDAHAEIPCDVSDPFSPIPYVIPLQLLAYYYSVNRKHDPDFPRNLAKSVTVR